MSQHFDVQDCSHAYRTEIPNIVYSLGLTPYELTLYNIYKKIAGDNSKCTMSAPKLAALCSMSEKKLRKCKESLCLPRTELDGLSLITCTCTLKDDGSSGTCIIKIVDIWPINMTKISKKKSGVKLEGGVGHHMPQGGAPRADKEEPLKKLEEEESATLKKSMKKKACEESIQKQEPKKATRSVAAKKELSPTEQKCYDYLCSKSYFSFLADRDKKEALLLYGESIVMAAMDILFERYPSLQKGKLPSRIESPYGFFLDQCKQEKNRRDQ